MVAPEDVTKLLIEWGKGNQAALEELTSLVYWELRRLALYRLQHEQADHSLQATELVHEAYMRLIIWAKLSTSITGINKLLAPNTKAIPKQFGDPGFQGNLVSIDIKEIDLKDMLRLIGDSYNVNFTYDGEVGGIPVTLKTDGVAWNQALEAMLKLNNLDYRREGNSVHVFRVKIKTDTE